MELVAARAENSPNECPADILKDLMSNSSSLRKITSHIQDQT